MPELLIAAFWIWLVGLVLALLRLNTLARGLLGLGALIGIVGAVSALMHPMAVATTLPIGLSGQPVRLRFTADALWLFGFGLVPATLALWLCSPVRDARPGWLFGAAAALIGALGVFGVQDGYSFLIAWELMSLGGAVMVLSERLSTESGSSTLFMLALLEAGAVALLVALLLLGHAAGGTMDFVAFASGGASMPEGLRVFVALLLLAGFGAKLGLLPFYEWFAGAYASGSGATGALMSGVILNAAFFALARGLIDWFPGGGAWLFEVGVVVIVVGVLSTILAVLYAFQQDDWRRLLALSSAENASMAVMALGACLIFREDGLSALAGLAWIVATLHLAGHSLAKGALFACADGIYLAGGSYRIEQRGWLGRAGVPFGIGALFAAMSLAAMPPQIGFATEWFMFQTLFQGFHLSSLAGRLILSLAGAGLAIAAAISLATFVKLFGVGLLGAGAPANGPRISARHGWAMHLLGVAVLATAVGLPLWLGALDGAGYARFGMHSAQAMVSDWLLVPLTNKFAFISPSKLVIAMPLLALLPLLLLLNARRHAVRRTRVWYGGMVEHPELAATTSLSFANAMRTFYSFIYRPTLDTTHEHEAVSYFVRKLKLTHGVADLFGPWLFAPLKRTVWNLAGRLRAFQSGDLNFYLAVIGLLLMVILALTLR
jgi:hydrogenase-4 component B